jgi:ribosomal protein S18 acetylase RimI-like enzyme
MRVRQRGTWPGSIAYRRGWSLATARPWNDDSGDAHLRLVRGSADFINECAGLLLGLADAVYSPPLAPGATAVWASAGFKPHLTLDLFQRDLLALPREPDHTVRRGADTDWEEAVAIDRAAFDTLWRLGSVGLKEALQATPTSEFLVTAGPDGSMAGFAIVGAGATTGYLQRVAVDPARQRQGFGRSLVRECLIWARKRGCSTMLLNTQPENDRAALLYESEGFTRVREGLEIWAYHSQEGGGS